MSTLSNIGLPIGSIFSGIGGLTWGIEAALASLGVASAPVWMCDCNPFSRAVLATHWPGAHLFRDVRDVHGGNASRVAILEGGSPCQDLSLVGKRGGLAGARSGLWSEQKRLARELRPACVVWENVGGALCVGKDKATGNAVPPAVAKVLADLDEEGYDAVWFTLSAAEVGAAHLRLRIFVVGVRRDPFGLTREDFGALGAPGTSATASTTVPPLELAFPRTFTAFPGTTPLASEPPRERPNSNVPLHMERIEALGNSVVPQVGFAVGLVVARLLGLDGRGGLAAVLGTVGAVGPRPNPPRVRVAQDMAGRNAVAVGERLGDRAVAAFADGIGDGGHGGMRPFLNLRAEVPEGRRGTVRSRFFEPFPAWGVAVNGTALEPINALLGRPVPTGGRGGGGATVPLVACGLGGCEQGDLVDALDLGLWPTCTARDWRSGKASAATRDRNSRPLSEVAAPNGFLVPEWAELHMGYPVGWTVPAQGFAQGLTPRKRGTKPCAAVMLPLA